MWPISASIVDSDAPCGSGHQCLPLKWGNHDGLLKEGSRAVGECLHENRAIQITVALSSHDVSGAYWHAWQQAPWMPRVSMAKLRYASLNLWRFSCRLVRRAQRRDGGGTQRLATEDHQCYSPMAFVRRHRARRALGCGCRIPASIGQDRDHLLDTQQPNSRVDTVRSRSVVEDIAKYVRLPAVDRP